MPKISKRVLLAFVLLIPWSWFLYWVATDTLVWGHPVSYNMVNSGAVVLLSPVIGLLIASDLRKQVPHGKEQAENPRKEKSSWQ